MSRRTFWDEPRPSVFRCAECGEKVPNPDELSASSSCSRCSEDLHSCRNCRYFDTSVENECRQAVTVRVPRKRANNDCGLFKPVMAVDLRGGSEEAKGDEARRAWEDLFIK
jgi:hypothetical protein